jgi:hypothetical protein
MIRQLAKPISFSLTVAAPSGRRPRPIEGDVPERRDCLKGPHRVTYHYEVGYIRPGRKTSTRVWIRDSAFVVVETAKRCETSPAYRVTWHDNECRVTDIVEFRNRLWWSIDTGKPAATFLSALAAGEPSAVGLLSGSLVPTGRRVAARDGLRGRIVEDGYINATISIHRGACDLLVIDDRVFIQDGEPIYVLWNDYIDPKLTTCTSHEFVEAVHGTDADFGYDDLTNALTFGHVFAPCDLEKASAFLPEAARHATIELLASRKFASDPIEVQMEAAYRKLLHIAAVPRRLPKAAFDEMVQRVGELRDAAGAPTTLLRARAMEKYLSWTEEFPWASSIRVEQRFLRHAINRIIAEGLRRDEHTRFSKPVLTEEDSAGLAMLSSY